MFFRLFPLKFSGSIFLIALNSVGYSFAHCSYGNRMSVLTRSVTLGSTLGNQFINQSRLYSCASQRRLNKSDSESKSWKYRNTASSRSLRMSNADKGEKPSDEWRQKLTSEQYHVCRQGGTEPAFTGNLLNNKEKGMYLCACCEQPLFSSDTKFDSGSGWPSFYDEHSPTPQVLGSSNVKQIPDQDGYRTEIRCKNCDCHLGHVFPDGPNPTGMRYCVNSLSLKFDKEEAGKK